MPWCEHNPICFYFPACVRCSYRTTSVSQVQCSHRVVETLNCVATLLPSKSTFSCTVISTFTKRLRSRLTSFIVYFQFIKLLSRTTSSTDTSSTIRLTSGRTHLLSFVCIKRCIRRKGV
eukprot:PhF_6_TR43570/c1_g1_i11/m.66919